VGDRFDLWLRFLIERKKERKTLDRIEQSMIDLTEKVEEGEIEIMGTLSDLAARLDTLDTTSSTVAAWVAEQLAIVQGQLVGLQEQVESLTASVAQNTVDAAQIDELAVTVDEITATIDAIDDPEVGPQPEPPVEEPPVEEPPIV
jgi:DNA repair exonuclease SbcCD ATPase subunit